MEDWNSLSMKDRAKFIRIGVENGLRDIDSIKNKYAEIFDEGGPIDNKIAPAKIVSDYPYEDRVRKAVETSDANWVNRLRTGDTRKIDNQDGTYSTHKMSWTSADGKYYVYPTIQDINGTLTEIPDNNFEAFESALKNKDYIVFDNEGDARYLAENHYKKYFESTKDAYEESQNKFDDGGYIEGDIIPAIVTASATTRRGRLKAAKENLKNLFTKATIQSAFNDPYSGAVMQASGWDYNNDGNLNQGDPNEEGARRLAEGLRAASTASNLGFYGSGLIAKPKMALEVAAKTLNALEKLSPSHWVQKGAAKLGTPVRKAKQLGELVDTAVGLTTGFTPITKDVKNTIIDGENVPAKKYIKDVLNAAVSTVLTPITTSYILPHIRKINNIKRLRKNNTLGSVSDVANNLIKYNTPFEGASNELEKLKYIDLNVKNLGYNATAEYIPKTGININTNDDVSILNLIPEYTDAVLAHEGTHGIFDEFNIHSNRFSPSMPQYNYYVANPHSPAYKYTQILNKHIDKSRPADKIVEWAASPEEVVAETSFLRQLTGQNKPYTDLNPFYKNRFSNFISSRFDITKQEAHDLLTGLSKYYANGGHLYEGTTELNQQIQTKPSWTPRYESLTPGYKAAVGTLAKNMNVPQQYISYWYNSGKLGPAIAGSFQGYPKGGRVKNNDSPTSEKSSTMEHDWNVAIYQGVKDNNNNIPQSYPNLLYSIPYLEDKEIKVKGIGRVTTNALDSLAKYSYITDVPLRDALGLSGQETKFGAVPYDNTMEIPDNATPEEVEKIKEYNRALLNSSYFRNYGQIPAEYLVRDFEYNRTGYEVDRKVPPLQHALKYYKEGKYNPNDPNHTRDVQAVGDSIMLDPAIQKWLESSEYAKKALKGKNN